MINILKMCVAVKLINLIKHILKAEKPFLANLLFCFEMRN